MPELLLPPGAAAKRRAQLAAPRGKGLGPAIHDIDPAKKIFKQVGLRKVNGRWEIPGFRLHGNRILVGVYERPDQLVSGLFIADQTRREDEHQGKAAVVLLLGHSAFKSDDHFEFGPDKVEVGDWISLSVADGTKVVVNGQLCRIIRDQFIHMAIPTPDSVY